MTVVPAIVTRVIYATQCRKVNWPGGRDVKETVKAPAYFSGAVTPYSSRRWSRRALSGGN